LRFERRLECAENLDGIGADCAGNCQEFNDLDARSPPSYMAMNDWGLLSCEDLDFQYCYGRSR
jgi:hypothetical protein